ncbi:MAG: hypothetical protein ACR2O4_00260 [Hyphomicrobiaceae bacterium]
MKNTIRILTAAVFAVGIWGATESFAGAGDDCKSYAQESAKQQQENEARSCKLAGDEWTTDIKQHMTWCQSVPPQKWKAALENRTKLLKACN